MADDLPTLVAAVLGTVSTFVAGLDRRALRDLASGRRVLVLAPAGAGAPEPPAARPVRQRGAAAVPIDAAHVTSHLAGLPDRAAARDYVAGLGGRDALRALAADLGVRVLSKDTKAETVRKIVDRTVGDRLGSSVMRGELAR